MNHKVASSVWQRLSCVIGSATGVLLILFMVTSYFVVDESAEQYVDYRNSFYISGLLVRQGMVSKLYPRNTDKGFEQTQFNQYAHNLLKHISSENSCNFLYPPLIAILFVPFSLLNPRISYLLWQLLSIALLALSALIFCSCSGTVKRPGAVFAISFLAFPLLELLIFGQVAIVIGILPLVLGYVLWLKGKNLPAGICFAALTMKAQLFLPVGCIILARLGAACLIKDDDGQRRDAIAEVRQLVSGLLIGILLFHIIPLLITGISTFAGWLNAIKLVDMTINSSLQPWARHLLISLPATIVSLSPMAWNTETIIVSRVVNIAIMLVLIIVLVRITLLMRSSPECQKDTLLVISFLFLPLIVPYVRLYDLTVLLLPTWIVFFRTGDHGPVRYTLSRVMILAWFALDGYIILIFLVGKNSMSVFTVMLILLWVEWCRQAACIVWRETGKLQLP